MHLMMVQSCAAVSTSAAPMRSARSLRSYAAARSDSAGATVKVRTVSEVPRTLPRSAARDDGHPSS